jgi:phytanoyl-CoA hydroxylase
MASCRARLLARFRSSGQLEPRTVKPRMVAYPFCPSWAAVGEQVTAGYAAFFFSLYGTRLSVIARTTGSNTSFLYTEPASCIGFWFALEDATIENGCLWVRPGGHESPLRSWFRRKGGNGPEIVVLDASPYECDDMQPLEVQKGACIVLHGLLPHYSLPNTSGKARPAYAIHAIDRHAHYPNANWLRRDLSTLRGFV